MKRSDTKRKPAQYFDIMVVPCGSAKIRRYELSRRGLKLALAGLTALCVVMFIGAASLVIYRNAYVATEDVRVQSAEFVRERAGLLNRVAELEGALSRVERFASKIEAAMNLPSKSNHDSMIGKGPVDEESWLPAPERSLSADTAIRLGANRWRMPFSKSLSSGLKLSLNGMAERLDAAEERVHSVFALQKDKLYFWASLPTIWPAKGWVTSEFGDGRSWGGSGRRHEGIDIAGPRGTPIMAPGSGVVTYTGYRRGYGNVMIIDHGYGISTLYGHCQSLFVNEGQQVKRGMVVASVGNTGRSTGPHLHYEVHVDEVPVNPLLYIMNNL